MAKEYTTSDIAKVLRLNASDAKKALKKLGHEPLRVVVTAKQRRMVWSAAAMRDATEYRAQRDDSAPVEREPVDLDVAQQVTTQLAAVSERLDQTVSALREVVRHVGALTAMQNGVAIQTGTTQDLVTAVKRTLDEVLEVITKPKQEG